MADYLDKLKNLDDRSIRSMLHVLRYQIHVLGTNVGIEKYDQDDEHRAAFGSAFQTDDILRTKREFSTSRYVINRNYLSDHYLKQQQPLIIYHDKPELAVGDVVTFRQDNIIYRFKVERKYSYGLSPHVIYKYDLIGMPESTGDSAGAGDSC